MSILLVIIFGAVVGLLAYNLKGSGFGLVWDMLLGITGYIITTFVMTGAYLMNGFGRANIIGLNWYSMCVGVTGSLMMIYGVWLYNRANPISKIGFVIAKIK